jgi:hypothetical protein
MEQPEFKNFPTSFNEFPKRIQRVRLLIQPKAESGVGMVNKLKTRKKNVTSWKDTGKQVRGLPLKECYPQAPDASEVYTSFFIHFFDR